MGLSVPIVEKQYVTDNSNRQSRGKNPSFEKSLGAALYIHPSWQEKVEAINQLPDLLGAEPGGVAV